MFVRVRLLKGYPELLWYRVPPSLSSDSLVGKLVRVPFRTQVIPALVVEQCASVTTPLPFTVKELIGREEIPQDPHYGTFIDQLTTYYQLEDVSLVKRLRQFLTAHETKPKEAIADTLPDEPKQAITLTDEQQAIVDYVAPHIIAHRYCPTLIHGVTGSGKTEVYKNLIEVAYAQGKTTIVLLPEVTLATNFEHIFRTQLSLGTAIFGFHSATSVSEKKNLWRALLANKSVLIIGVHLPILLPIANLGLIIVDEEHDNGFQEKKHPKINSKEAAIWRASLAQIPLVMGSATPSIQSLANIERRHWKLFHITKRFAGSFPHIQVVFLPDKKQRHNFWISRELELAIKDRLIKREQIIIFHNRRGYNFFVQCKDCGSIFSCNNCSVSLTVHESQMLTCHYCGFSITFPERCFSCNAQRDHLIGKGIGTQQVMSIIQKLFPTARVARADLDVTVNRKHWQRTMHDFRNQNIDILVGTQTITKGYHFPNVTLVGVIWADLNLHFPLYHAAEQTLQQLIQVAGRAGRDRAGAHVIIQTMTEHAIFNYLSEVHYHDFYRFEMEQRQRSQYPPAIRLAEIEFIHEDEQTVEQESRAAAQLLRQNSSAQVHILGPAKPLVDRIKNKYARKIYIKSVRIAAAYQAYQKIQQQPLKSSIYFTP